MIAILRKIFDMAVRDGTISVNLVASIRCGRIEASGRKAFNILEIRAILGIAVSMPVEKGLSGGGVLHRNASGRDSWGASGGAPSRRFVPLLCSAVEACGGVTSARVQAHSGRMGVRARQPGLRSHGRMAEAR